MYQSFKMNIMKKTLKLSVLVIAFFASFNLFAIESNPTDPVKKENRTNAKNIFGERNDKVYVVLDNPELNTVYIEVRDAIDRLVYKETFKNQDAIKKAFDFTKAYTGLYHITVYNGNNTFYKSIEI